jgi:myo-inositol-1(or 4)-monophosphatase
VSVRRIDPQKADSTEKRTRFTADDPEKIIAFARDLVLACGQHLRNLRASTIMEIREKGGPDDIVTDHDVWIQSHLTTEIARKYPAHAILAEEGLDAPVGGEWTWIIDPIDGTTNYCGTGEHYAISVGVFHHGAPYYGLVLDVAGGRLHEGRALPGGAAFDTLEAVERSMLLISYKTIRDLAAMGGDPMGLCARFRGVRAWGCASLELCEIARMRGGLYLNSRLKIWDFAAAASILTAAGCFLRAVPLPDGRWFVAAFRSLKLMDECAIYLPEPLRQRLLAPENGGAFHAGN